MQFNKKNRGMIIVVIASKSLLLKLKMRQVTQNNTNCVDIWCVVYYF